MLFHYFGEGLLYLVGLPLAAFQCFELLQALPDLISNFTDWHQL
ncbi:hypothetical protein [Effusibacillus pohliae]|nr:hypothetical protein [Effusibacillus pohliae]